MIINFPFSMYPEKVNSGNMMYSMEAYKSILLQMQKGVPVYFNEKLVGKSMEFIGNQIIVEVTDKDAIAELEEDDEDSLSMTSRMDGDAEKNKDGVLVVNSCIVEALMILRKRDLRDLILENKDKEDVCFCKEATLKLEETVHCVTGCNGLKDLCIPHIIEKCNSGSRVFVMYGEHVKEKLDEIGKFKFEYVTQNNTRVGMWIEGMKSFITKKYLHDNENEDIKEEAVKNGFNINQELKYLGYEVKFDVEVFEDGSNKVLKINDVDVSLLNISI